MPVVSKIVPIKDIKPNPDNPRVIKNEVYKKLVQSIKDFPEMKEAREIVVNKDMVILGGNMRYRAMLEVGLTEVPVKIVDWDEAKQKEFIIKDNVANGEWDMESLANSWDSELLTEWGVDLPADFAPEFDDKGGDNGLRAKDKVVCPSCGLEFTP